MKLCLSVFLLYLIHLSSGNDEGYKNKLADSIIRRLYNITVKAFSNGTAEEKEITWKIFETKLKLVTYKRYGPDTGKYIDLIMRGIKTMALNTISPPLEEPVKKPMRKNVEKVVHAIKSQIDSNKKSANATNSTDIGKKKIRAQNIVTSVDTAPSGFYNNTVDKKQVIDNIRQKIMDLIIRKHNVVKSETDIKLLGQRLANEIESVVDTVISNYSNSNNHQELKNDKPRRDMKTQVVTTPASVSEDYKGVTSTVNCEVFTDKVCRDLRYTNKITCPLDGKKISIEQLCDGVNDCADQYDERDCIKQVISKIKDARRLISNIEETVVKNNCAGAHTDHSLLSKQSDVLGSVIKSELLFLKKHSNQNKTDDSFINQEIVKRTVNEVALVLSSLSKGLEGSLCPRYYGQDGDDHIHKNTISWLDDNTDLFEDLRPSVPQPKSFSPNKCACDGGSCTDMSCSQMCRLVCWQKHSLSHFGCQAIDGGTSVPLAVLCDGKTDCYKQTDEEDCSVGDISRFEAIAIYDDILTDLSSKAQVSEMQYIRDNLLSLRKSVSHLQKVTTQPKPAAESVRTVRDMCIDSLISTYNKVLNRGNIQNLDDIHNYLLSLNQKLISALKQSHTGNDRIITVEGCYCDKNRCAMSQCSKKCKRACSVEMQLTGYSCDGSPTSSVFVPSHGVCNGKSNCPKGEDEIDCQKESCRAHHLVVLRHDLSHVGDKEKGTTLGASLNTWKTKVITTLLVAEGNSHLALKMVRDVMDSITRDLVATYASFSTDKTEQEKDAFKIFFGTCQWVKGCLSQNSIPAGALMVGCDADHEEIFAGRVEHEGDVVPALISPTKNTCSISYDGEEVAVDQFEVLVPAKLCWQTSYDGAVPPFAVEAGETADGEKVYFGRVSQDGATVPGKIIQSLGVCIYGVDGEERSCNEYECLVFV